MDSGRERGRRGMGVYWGVGALGILGGMMEIGKGGGRKGGRHHNSLEVEKEGKKT